MSPRDTRVRVTFAALNALAGVVLLVAVALVKPRFWLLDLPVALIAFTDLACAAGLFLNARWQFLALRIAAWVSLGAGLLLVALVVLTISFLRGILGDYGVAAMAVCGLVIALLVPYTLLLPIVELLWLGPARAEAAPIEPAS